MKMYRITQTNDIIEIEEGNYDLICFNIHGLENTEDIKRATKYVNTQPYTACSFISPDHYLTVFVKVDPIPITPNEYKQACAAIAQQYPKYKLEPSKTTIKKVYKNNKNFKNALSKLQE